MAAAFVSCPRGLVRGDSKNPGLQYNRAFALAGAHVGLHRGNVVRAQHETPDLRDFVPCRQGF
jgi:hypothetical protein